MTRKRGRPSLGGSLAIVAVAVALLATSSGSPATPPRGGTSGPPRVHPSLPDREAVPVLSAADRGTFGPASPEANRPSTGRAASSVDWEVTFLSAGYGAISVLSTENGHWIYVANGGSDTVSIYNGTDDISAGVYTIDYEPTVLAFDAAGSILFAVNRGADTANLINVTTKTTRETNFIGAPPVGVAFDPADRQAFVATTNAAGILSINETTLGLHGLARFNSSVGSAPAAIVYDPAINALLVDFSDTGNVAVVDPTTLNVTRVIAGLDGPGPMLYDPNNDVVYIDQPNSTFLTVWNATSLEEVPSIEVGEGAGALTLDAPGHRLFVECDANGSLAIVDDRNETVEGWGVTGLGKVAGSIAYDPAGGTVDFAMGSNRLAVTAPPLSLNASTISPTAADVGVPVTFSAKVTGGIPPIATVAWTFGDGGFTKPSNGNATHAYEDPGTYYAFAETSDGGPGAATWGLDVVIAGPPDAATPVASAVTDSIDVGESVTFTMPIEGGTPPFTFNWSGLPYGCPRNTEPAVCPKLETAGPYAISAAAVDADGFTTRSASPLAFEVYPLPTASVPAPNRTSIDVGENISFASQVLGDGAGSVEFNWTHSSADVECDPGGRGTLNCEGTAPGSFVVSVRATDSDGGGKPS